MKAQIEMAKNMLQTELGEDLLNYLETELMINNDYEFEDWVIDSVDTNDGYTIYWLHAEGDYTLDPENLYYDEYNFEEACREKAHGGAKIKNYYYDDDEVSRWCAEYELYNELVEKEEQND
jgi:hypothetical protein